MWLSDPFLARADHTGNGLECRHVDGDVACIHRMIHQTLAGLCSTIAHNGCRMP
jgi:hypothetical protein